MTDQADRERESRETELTGFEREQLEEQAERERAGDRLQDEPQREDEN